MRPGAGSTRSRSHGEIVELAAGTGWWSPLLADKGELSLYDGDAGAARSGPRAPGRPSACGRTSTSATPGPSRTARSTRVFTGFWLSHVPRARLDDVPGARPRWLKPGGIFAFIDSLPDPQSSAADHPTARRRPAPSAASMTAASSRSSRSTTSRPSWRPP